MRFLAKKRDHDLFRSKSRKESADSGFSHMTLSPADFPARASQPPVRVPEHLDISVLPIDYLIWRKQGFEEELFISATSGEPDTRDLGREKYCRRAVELIDRELDARDE